MGLCCKLVFIFIGCEFVVMGHNTSPATFDHGIDISVFRSLQDDVRILRLEYESTVKQMIELTKELQIVQNDLRNEKERRIILEHEIAFLKNASCETQEQIITEKLQSGVQFAKRFTSDLDLEQEQNDLRREINKTQKYFETKLKATSTAISSIITKGIILLTCHLLYFIYHHSIIPRFFYRFKKLHVDSVYM